MAQCTRHTLASAADGLTDPDTRPTNTTFGKPPDSSHLRPTGFAFLWDPGPAGPKRAFIWWHKLLPRRAHSELRSHRPAHDRRKILQRLAPPAAIYVPEYQWLPATSSTIVRVSGQFAVSSTTSSSQQRQSHSRSTTIETSLRYFFR